MGAVILLGERSQKNAYVRHILGLYLYSIGASQQQISVLNHLGLSVSYTTLAGRGHHKDESGMLSRTSTTEKTTADGQEGNSVAETPAVSVPQYSRPGTLELLSRSMRHAARQKAASGPFMIVYDNINWINKATSQIVGRIGESRAAPSNQ